MHEQSANLEKPWAMHAYVGEVREEQNVHLGPKPAGVENATNLKGASVYPACCLKTTETETRYRDGI